MFNRLAKGVNSLLEFSGEESPDGDPQDVLVPQTMPVEASGSEEPLESEETLERLAQLEQLVVQLKDLIREKDSQLATTDSLLKSERETADARFTKLKLQAKAKMATLSKQIADLKGQEGANITQSPDSSFTTIPTAVEEELQELRLKLSEEQSSFRALLERLETSEQLCREKEEAHTEQLRVLQTVVCEKDVRFQEQIQKHEEELLTVTRKSQDATELQQALRAAQRRCEEQEEAMRSRSQVLEMLQQELNNADQQKQILTAQFREMEQELAEAGRQREEERQHWAQQTSRAEAELGVLRATLEASERDRAAQLEELIAKLESSQRASHEEMGKGKEAMVLVESELAALRERLENSDQEREEAVNKVKLEAESSAAQLEELRGKLELVERESEEGATREGGELARLERELAALREELEGGQRAGEVLAELWRGLSSLSGGDVEGAEEESPVPTDPALFLGTLQAVEARLWRLGEEQRESKELCAQVTETMENLHEQLDRSTAEGKEGFARIQQLEQQIGVVSAESLVQHVIDPSVQDLSNAEKAQILTLERQLLEKGNELAALQDRLAQAEEQNSRDASEGSTEQIPDQNHDTFRAFDDSPTMLPDLLEDTPEDETTLVAEDSSVLSVSADTESSPELIGPQSESPGESKGASSDEMVTSSDSEVAHSSWTLLEAVNQDGGQEWPSILQDFGQLQLQSWEETSTEQETSTVQVKSSSIVIRETVQVNLSQQGASLFDSDSNPGQVFAQTLAVELQKRYSELLAELQRLREADTASQERNQALEDEIKSLASAKDEVESRAQSYEEELKSARTEIDKLTQHNGSEVERESTEMQLLEEKLASLKTEACSNEQKIQALQADLDKAQHFLSEQEGQARMLSAQLEDRELISSELEQKLQDMEASLLEFSQTKDMANASLSEKDTEISELQLRLTQKEQEMMALNAHLDDRELTSSELEQKLQDMEASLLEFCQTKDMANASLSEKDTEISELQMCLSQKEQEMMELSDNMSAKLLQAGEEKFLTSSEIKKLKEQILQLERAGNEQQEVRGESTVKVDDEFACLQKHNIELTTQMATLKKKFQAALVQRKELMRRVGEYEKEAEKRKEQEAKATKEAPASEPDIEKDIDVFGEVRQALRSKEEEVETLERRISQQDQVLAETIALNRKLSEEAEQTRLADTGAVMIGLQSQVTSLESECESLQKKLQEAQDARKDTIRKAKEKDRHHREQLKQQKDDYNELLERFEEQGERLLTRLGEIEEQQPQREENTEEEVHAEQKTKAEAEKLKKPVPGDWVQEDWVDFAAPETEAQQQWDQSSTSDEYHSQLHLAEKEATLQALREEVQTEQIARTGLEGQLQETQTSLLLKESELLQLGKELEALREMSLSVSDEMDTLREKCLQAEDHAETLRTEVKAATQGYATDFQSPISIVQTEVEKLKQFLNSKNEEIMELSQQLGEQNSFLRSMQETVSEKDQLISSLQESLRAEQEKSQRLEAEVPQRQEEEKDSGAKIQQLQRKLQAALISRKDALKENKNKKEELASTERVIAELQQKIEAKGSELEKLRAEKEKLIEEVDRTLVENQSLEASCESLKLAMEGMLTEKDTCKKEAESAKEEATRACKEWEEKVEGMKDEYETLLKSYENVSDEAERVRRVLEAARQERQELAARVRTHDAARLEAERLKEEAQKEVDSYKDKMRKFAKTKQQKIMDLEEENERLRELDEKKGITREDKGLKMEIERLKEELEALKADLVATTAQRDTLEQQAVELREQLAQELEKETNVTLVTTPGSDAVVEEAIVAQQSIAVMAEVTQEPVESQPQDIEQQSQAIESEVAAPETHSIEETVKMEMSESAHALLEENLREMETTLQTEKELRQEREAELNAELASLEQRLQESEERELSMSKESSKREAQLKELLSSLEAEKDDLEERLMNQLAQLNGSIAGYQQEASDSRERLAELQREVEMLERERAELEALADSESDRAARLEEDKRQAQRERGEAEAEAGKQRELEQKLKSAQRIKEGSQSRVRQLEELLREKQLEVRQMQKDCIEYQERISELGRDAKAMQLGYDELHSELEKARLETAKAVEKMKETEAKLSSCKAQLGEAQREASQAMAEKTACEQTALQREAEMKAEAEQTLDSVRFRLGAELKQTELRLEDAYRENERQEEATREIRQLAEGAERRAQEVQARSDENLARLAALSGCMSSLQNDRDRVLDEARQWESRFNGTLQGKEAEVREAETRARNLAEQLQRETTLREELQLAVDRLQKADEQLQLKWEEEEKRLRESQAALEQERGELQRALAQAESSLAEARAQLASLENEAEGLRHRAQALDEAVGKLQGDVNKARAELRERETEERRLGLSVEQLETDLHSSKTLTEILQTELSEKEKREVELLGEKEQAVTQAAEEARKEADSRALEAEKELEDRREEVRGLEDRLRKAEEESSHSKARLDAFTKAMGSLQDDRDRVLSMYKQLEEKHLKVMMEKDGLIQEAAGENNSLKEELRSLLVQRDDLHAEKAKLSAQLHGYRDDLNQVLSMKDSQHKQLLAGQLERIASLERDREELDAKLRILERGREVEGEVLADRVERETLSQAGDSGRGRQGGRDAPGAEVEKLREQLQASRGQVEDLEESLRLEKEEQTTHGKELAELRWEGGVMRTESETAQERVAELARDILTLEQILLEEREASAQLRAQNQSFGQAMASLQNSRDQLSLRVEEMSRAGGQQPPAGPGGSTGEVWGLKNALSALQNDRERLLEQLQFQHSQLIRLGAGDLAKVIQELEEERRRAEEMLARMREEDEQRQREKQELEILRLESVDWQAQAELLKQQTLATLSDRDQQVRQLSAMLEEARMPRTNLLEEHYQREPLLGTDMSTDVEVPQSESGPLHDPQTDLDLREEKITELSNKLSQVSEEKSSLSFQLRGSSQRLDEAESRCTDLQRQLQELHEDKSKGTGEVDSAPGAPQERSGPSQSEGFRAECKELQRRLDEEQEQRVHLEEQLMSAHDRLKQYTQGEWHSPNEGQFSETAVLIEPPGSGITRTRSSGRGVMRMLRGAFCSRQRTPLLVSLYLLAVHVLLLLCLGGYL